MKLVQPFLDKGHTVYMDNYYSSPELFHDLLVRKTTATGTVLSKHNISFATEATGFYLGIQDETSCTPSWFESQVWYTEL